jgi:hypothetical protein
MHDNLQGLFPRSTTDPKQRAGESVDRRTPKSRASHQSFSTTASHNR